MPRARRTFQDVPPALDSDALERDVLAWWDKDQTFVKSVAAREGRPRFTFYDGPPYATGLPHYGHMLQSAIKDTVLRYKTMRGLAVPRRVGWDCHGLPVEILVERELGFTSKRDIETLGLAAFNDRCRSVVFRYIKEFTATLKRIGRWADYEGAYTTLTRDYMESEWWVFKQLWDQQLVYQAFRSTPYCIRCATPLSNFEVTSNYHDRDDEAVYVPLKIRPETLPKGVDRSRPHCLLVWTTTPWTLPANVAVAYNPAVQYVSVAQESAVQVVAAERRASLFGDAPVAHEWTAAELKPLRYEPLYTFLPVADAWRLVASAHVTVSSGTGLVHVAPAFGEEDAALAEAAQLPVVVTVDRDGRFVPSVTPWAGRSVFEANPDIREDLSRRGVLFKRETIRHRYPYCWRCDQPLIYYALKTWFIRVTALKARMLQSNEEIHWTPTHVKHGRFAKGIVSAPDWAVSRNRFWSVPLPVWACDRCAALKCLGSIAELKERTGLPDIPDLHRPAVDQYTWPCRACGGTMRRVEEVLDVWFDSAVMPYAQWHYPFARKREVEAAFPADFIAEAIEMTRAWFYVLHVVATALTTTDIGLGVNQPAFRAAIASGIIFGEDGQKLSKKLKNFPDIAVTIRQYGADALRFYLLTSSRLGEPYRFTERDLKKLRQHTVLMLWNVYSFFVRYANTHHWQPPAAPKRSPKPGGARAAVLDRWIRARLTQLQAEVTRLSDNYQIDQAARLFVDYFDDLSNWYVRRSRGRFQHPPSAAQAAAAFGTLYEVLVGTARLLAPFMPFLAEAIHRNLVPGKSVHLADLPDPPALAHADHTVLATMGQARAIVAAARRARAGAKMRVRQPLAELVVQGPSLPAEVAAIVADEVNVKAVTFAATLPAPGYAVVTDGVAQPVALDVRVTEALHNEGIAREIIRRGQALRRQAGCALDERIALVLVTRGARVRRCLQRHRTMVLDALQADALVDSRHGTVGQEATIGGETVYIGVRRVPKP